MMLNEITALAGPHKRRMRVGRGESSGKGKTCGRGNKGCQSRAGGGVRLLTEGGQMPLFRRLPKRGFSNYNFRTEYAVVNVGTLNERFDDGATVDFNTLRKVRLVHDVDTPVRILGQGALEKRLSVEAHAFSQKAKEAIEKAGGTVRVIMGPSAAEKAAKKRKTAKVRRAASRGARPGDAAPGPADSTS
jgi:large subunit ribosomal protein L15